MTIDPSARGRGAWRPALLFGALAFIQGLADPTEGLASQPARSLLKSWGRADGEIARFAAWVAIPWALKPLYGLISDLLPLAGSRRRGYLIVAGAGAALAFLAAGTTPVARLLPWLTAATLAVAFADVVADALLIEVGGPAGAVGHLQASQWGCLWAATILAGSLGGYLSGPGRQPSAFLLCGGASLATMLLAVAFVRDPPRSAAAKTPLAILNGLALAAKTPGFRAVGGFLFLWNFNPYGTAILHLHATKALGLSEQAFGHLSTLFAAASLAASVVYGAVLRRLPWPILVRASIPLGVFSSLVYGIMSGPRTAAVATVLAGFAYMVATLIQLELAARACPPGSAGTVFATLMALENLAAALSLALGGELYERGTELWGPNGSFRALLIVGAAFTACSWLLLPWLPLENGEESATKGD